MSTLEDGVMVRSGDGWTRYSNETLSSNPTRQMVEFQNALYVRHGSGKVDKFDGRKWQRNVFPYLPRGKAMTIAADDDRLYIGQWGGWSEWDGKNWTHVLRLADLQGLPLMSLQPAGDIVT